MLAKGKKFQFLIWHSPWMNICDSEGQIVSAPRVAPRVIWSKSSKYRQYGKRMKREYDSINRHKSYVRQTLHSAQQNHDDHRKTIYGSWTRVSSLFVSRNTLQIWWTNPRICIQISFKLHITGLAGMLLQRNRKFTVKKLVFEGLINWLIFGPLNFL